jgi:hypothetical protein
VEAEKTTGFWNWLNLLRQNNRVNFELFFYGGLFDHFP